MNFETLMETATAKACELRNICTLLKRPDFERMYDKGSDHDREQVLKLVEAGAHEALRAWYRSKLHRELGDKSVRELRQIAAELAIPDYTRLNKSLLLSEIVTRQKHEERSDKSGKAAS
jgi:hypothetical protein